MVRLHPRYSIATRGQLAIRDAIDRIAEEHGLTDVETHQALLAYMQSVAKGWLRAERHPDDPDKKGDEE